MSDTFETKMWRDYQDGLIYQRSMGFSEKFPEFERFKQGDQWPQATERTKSLPRPVFNIVKLFISNKKSNVLNQKIKMLFTPAEVNGQDDLSYNAAQDYTDFAENLWYELDQEGLNDAFVEDAATTGTGILHYYWDSTVSGGQYIKYNGALRGETLDPLNVFFANPQETNIQKQPWIIISSRDMVKNVKELAKNEGLSKEEIELIRPDNETTDEGYDTAKLEMQEGTKITVLTRYFKKNGQVYFSKSVRGVDIIKDRRLGVEINNEETGEKEVDRALTLYPIVIFNWNLRKKCIFGSGETEGLIPNQKAINFNIGMMLLSVQDNAWPKILAKPGALKQAITNKPGEIITDFYTSGDGIKYMQPPNFNYMAVNLVDKVMELSRTTSGVTEITTGEQLGANMAASAIIALQNQAKVPIDNIQQRFYRSQKEVGKIWEQFFKVFYLMPRNMSVIDEGQIVTREFNGGAYADVEFKMKIDVGAASIYSESLSMSTLDKMYDKGDITVDDYIALAPDAVMPFKEELKKLRAKRIEQEMTMQQGMVQQIPMEQQITVPMNGGNVNGVF